MTPTTDPLELLVSFRPTADLLEQDWPDRHRAAMRAEILTSSRAPVSAPLGPRQPRRHRTPWFAAAVLVGAAVVALLVVQLVLPSNRPGGPSAAVAATLERLANAAQNSPADPIRPGQFRHLLARSSDGDTIESWTSHDGDIWQRVNDHGTLLYYHYAPGNYINDPSPPLLASLPTNPDSLQTFLRSHVSGSTSTDEAVFVAVGDMLRGGFAPPALRAAAIRVLERTGHISASPTHDTLGRSAIKVSFTDPVNRPGQTESLLFDPTTSALLEEQSQVAGRPGVFATTYSHTLVVNKVPAAVVSNAAKPQPDDPAPPPIPVSSLQPPPPTPTK